MLTRLEVDGFKNLVDFSIDFGPYTCIAGPNGIGKSNIFDAIHFLSLLADKPIIEAAAAVRTGAGDLDRLDDLFFRSGSVRRDSFRIAVEILVERQVSDDFGRPGTATSTFLRYEIEIGQKTAIQGNVGQSLDIELRSESLHPIRKGDAARKLRFPHSKSKFRDRAVQNHRFTKAGYISTENSNGEEAEIVVHQDGGSRGPGQKAPARRAPRTIVGTTNTIATPTILAARREMQGWRLLSLEPSAMRRPDRLGRDPDIVSDNGAHLAAALYRLKNMEIDDGDAIANISSRLSELVPVTHVDVIRDEARQLLTLSVTERDGQQFSASAISDGTLRFLALAILAEDPRARSLLCIEEPENGVHPERLDSMANLVRDLAVDADDEPEDGNAIRQAMLATHSPYFLQLQNKEDVLLAREVVQRNDGGSIRLLRCYPLEKTWRARSGEANRALGLSMMLEYLQPPANAQLTLPLEFQPAPLAPIP